MLGWGAWVRFRRARTGSSSDRPAAWVLVAGAGVCVVLAGVLPPLISPAPAASRPHTDATISFISPTSGEVFHGDPAHVNIQVRVDGARIVRFTSSHLVPDEGHVHIYIDRRLVCMTFTASCRTNIPPGEHVILAEFVAVDHGPFAPPVTASVRITVVG